MGFTTIIKKIANRIRGRKRPSSITSETPSSVIRSFLRSAGRDSIVIQVSIPTIVVHAPVPDSTLR